MKARILLALLPLWAFAACTDKAETPALTALDYFQIQQLVASYARAIDTCSNNGYDYADLFTPDGFVAAQMIVQAISEAGPDDVDAMITALEDWTFEAPKGTQTIRASDHAMLQPMFTVRLVDAGDGTYTAELIDTLDAEATAPPES